jgi:hypothetical protein
MPRLHVEGVKLFKNNKVSLILKFAALKSALSQHFDGHFRSDKRRFNAQDPVTIVKREIPAVLAHQRIQTWPKLLNTFHVLHRCFEN